MTKIIRTLDHFLINGPKIDFLVSIGVGILNHVVLCRNVFFETIYDITRNIENTTRYQPVFILNFESKEPKQHNIIHNTVSHKPIFTDIIVNFEK